MRNRFLISKTYLLLIVIFSIKNYASIGQTYNPEKISKKVKLLYEKALAQIDNKQWNEGIQSLQKCIVIDNQFADGYLSLAGVYSQQKQYAQAIAQYQQAKQIDSIYFIEYYLPYSISLAGLGQFNQALEAVNRFLAYPKNNTQSIKAATYRKNSYQFAINFAQQHAHDHYIFTTINLGDSVNSSFSEYFPSLTIDGKTLVFTRRLNNINEDFFETQQQNNYWSNAKALTGSINTNYNEGAQTISQDGGWLIFTGCNFPEGKGGCDLYISKKIIDDQSSTIHSSWSTPQNLGNAINTEFWESTPSLSPDKKDLYFSSNRPGGFGGSDLYVSHQLANGKWSMPENLGSNINTNADESCPFIHADNQTLYFTSNGWPGYGGTDLFMSKKTINYSWSTPKNLGYPVNTIDNEGSLMIAADAQTAYYASDRADSKGGLDLYTFTVRKDIQPTQTFWITGYVYDSITKKGLPSGVEIINPKTKKIVSYLQTDTLGKYLIILPIGEDYMFVIKKKGYLYYADAYNLSTASIHAMYEKNIALQPIQLHSSMVLKHIYFKTNLYTLEDVSKIELDKLVDILQENTSIRIQIDGHTDNIGSEKTNMLLSTNRARAVVNYLVEQGIHKNRLLFKGYGSTKPVVPNDTEAHRAINRRTEFRVVAIDK